MSKVFEALERLYCSGNLQLDYVLSNKHKQDYDIIKQALHRLESIDNANPSEALECLERIDNTLCLNNNKGKLEFGIDTEEHTDCDSVIGMTEDLESIKQALLKAEKEHNSVNLLMQELDCKDFAELRKYARCGYEKLNKKYLKWEDLEFKIENQEMFVLLNGSYYLLEYYNDSEEDFVFIKTAHKTVFALLGESSDDKQFFNDLHLERAEE